MITLNEKICQVKDAIGNQCGRKIHGNGKCIFHFPWDLKIDIKNAKFEEEFWKEFQRMEANNFIKALDFTNFIFPIPISFRNQIFKKKVFFIKAKFIRNADFGEAQFRDIVNFGEALFNDIADFGGAQFADDADFEGTQFRSITNFDGAQFRKEANFSTKFNDVARFPKAKFNDNANFNVAQFDRMADFAAAQFDKIAIFKAADFKDVALFTQAQFTDEADFSEAKFSKEAIFRNTQFNNIVDFSDSEFMSEVIFIGRTFYNKHLINFHYCKFHKPKDAKFQFVNLSNVSFLYTDIAEVEFLNESWGKKNGRIIVVDESRIMEDKTITYDAVAQLYRRLRRNYEDNYRFEEAGNFFIGEMEMRRLDVTARFKNENKILKRIELLPEFFLLIIYKLLSRYGESYIRPAIIGIIVIIFYPLLIHLLLNIPLPDDSVLIYMRTSAASFFQMDNKYVGERLIGIPTLGLLFIALKRKFERKR